MSSGRSFQALNLRSVDNMLDVIEPLESSQEDAETLSEQVFRRIQAAIVKGEIAPGSKISEPELARTYGISRGPLREAIHRLEGQRLLVRVPHIGARVVSLSHAELIELYDPSSGNTKQLNSMLAKISERREQLEQQLLDIEQMKLELDTAEERCVQALEQTLKSQQAI